MDTTNVVKLDTGHIKEATIPEALELMETSDATVVIHLKDGRWKLQHLKGSHTIWSLVGMFQTISTHLCNVANGVSPLK